MESPDGKLEYVKRKDIDKVKRIVQRDYYQDVLDRLRVIRGRIERFLKIYDMDSINEVYNNLSDAKKVLVVPTIPTDEQYIELWRKRNVGGMNSFPEEGQFLTIRGEKVRSKSEKILADMFEKLGVPYSYEPQVRINDGKYLYPDFALLNVRTRKTVYWEHFGLASDGEYAKSALSKLELYEQAGLELGTDLIVSMEFAKMPLNIKQITGKINKYLL